jgi:hypothetical protein
MVGLDYPFLSVGRLPDHLYIPVLAEQQAQPLPDNPVIVHNQHPDSHNFPLNLLIFRMPPFPRIASPNLIIPCNIKTLQTFFSFFNLTFIQRFPFSGGGPGLFPR